ncbi:MAG: hypothetical protein HDR88_12860 [Bacteroides sp.]|nr:hypothetical protein [Bacteroides sp.]
MQLRLLICCVIGLLSISVISGKVTEEARADFYATKINDPNASISQKLSWIDSLIKLKPLDRDLKLRKMEEAYNAGNYPVTLEMAKTILKDTLDLTPLRDDKKLLVINRYATASMYTEDYLSALQHTFQLKDANKPDSLKYYDIESELLLHDIYRSLKMYPVAYRHLENADHLTKIIKLPETKQNRILASINLARSGQFISDKKFDKAFDEIRLAKAKSDDPKLNLWIDAHAAIIYDRISEPDIAKELFEKVRMSTLDHVNKVYTLYNYARFLMRRGKTDSAIIVSNENMELADRLGIEAEKELIYGGLSEIYESRGDYQNAYKNLVMANVIADSIFSAKFQHNVAEITEERANLEINKENSRHIDRLSIMTMICILLALIVLGCLVGLIIVVKKLKIRNIENKSLQDNLQDYTRQLTGLREEMAKETEATNQQLASLSLQMLNLSRQRKQLEKSIGNKLTGDKEKLSDVKEFLKGFASQESALENFRHYFDKVHNGFFTSLGRQHPELTPGETQICAYILLNLSTREIAEMTNRSPRTVETIKYNISKKLPLNEGQTVRAYLLTIDNKIDNQ